MGQHLVGERGGIARIIARISLIGTDVSIANNSGFGGCHFGRKLVRFLSLSFHKVKNSIAFSGVHRHSHCTSALIDFQCTEIQLSFDIRFSSFSLFGRGAGPLPNFV